MKAYPLLPLLFLVAGLALLAALAYLAQRVRTHRSSLAKLLQLAQSGLDPLQLPAAAWPTLASGGIVKLEYSGLWFGQAVQNNLGTAPNDSASHPFSFNIIADGDVYLEFYLYAQDDRGEARLFAENLAGVFRLLLETAMHSKMVALSAALAEQAKLTLYLQHDLRNLAQWVEWLAADFASTQNNADLLGIAKRLYTSAPHAAMRARHILDATCKNPPITSRTRQVISLVDAIRDAAEHAGIAIEIEQEATAFLRRDLLDRTLDNLFSNVAPLLRLHAALCVRVSISHDADKVVASIHIPRLPEVVLLPPERLFEPFASGRPGGLGLGLYQAHKSAIEAGGDLLAELCDEHICFFLTLPGTPATPV
jgi:signal transduction histidine kinase